jgi:hypothetical protein
MGLSRDGHAAGMRWSVEIPTLTPMGTSGVHTFIVRAATFSEAIETAWAEAQSSDAVRRRKGATLAVEPVALDAFVLPDCFC